MNDPIKMRTTPHISLVLDPEDGTDPKTWKTWKLCFTYKAIAKIEEAIQKDIKKIADWNTLSSGKDFPVIVWGGLDKFNPDVTLEQVTESLNPEAQRALSDAIFELMFPGAKEAYEKILSDEKATGATADPNVPAVPVTTA